MLIVTHELQFARAIADRISLWIRESSLRKVLLKNSSIIQRHSELKSSSMSLISVSLVPICNPLFLVKNIIF